MADHVLPIGGGWIIVKRRLPTQVQVPLLSIFYALPDRVFPAGWHTDRYGDLPGSRYSSESLSLLWRHRHKGRIRPDERERAKAMEDEPERIDLDQRVRILAPDGEVCVEPYEWERIPDLSPYLSAVDGEHVKLHDYGIKPSGTMADQLFYLRTRGIARADALELLFGEVRKPNVFWLELHPAYAEFFALDRPRERKRSRGLPPMRVKIERTHDAQAS